MGVDLRLVILPTAFLFFVCFEAEAREEEYVIDCGSNEPPCSIEGLADQMKIYSNNSFNVSFTTPIECCDVTCNILLRIHDGQVWKKYKDYSYDDCSDGGSFWNCSVLINSVESNASFCLVIAPEDRKHFSEPFDVAVQGLPDPVCDVSSKVTCSSTCVCWDRPDSLLPVTYYMVTVNEVAYVTTETCICYSQDIIEPNTNTTISIVAVNEVGAGDAVETYVLSSMEPKGNITHFFLTYGNESYDVLSVVIAPMVPSCPPSFPLNVEIVCTNCGINCANSLADLQKYTSLTVNCSFPSFEQFQAIVILTNLEGNDSLPMNFSTNLAQSFVAYASDGVISYRCKFVLDAPIDECYIELENLANSEVTFSEAKNDANDGIAYNTTENLCIGSYTATCYYIAYNATSKKDCALENITVDITNSNVSCSSNSIPTPTHSPAGPSFTHTSSYSPKASPTSSPDSPTTSTPVGYIIGGIFVGSVLVVVLALFTRFVLHHKKKSANTPSSRLSENRPTNYGSADNSDASGSGGNSGASGSGGISGASGSMRHSE